MFKLPMQELASVLSLNDLSATESNIHTNYEKAGHIFNCTPKYIRMIVTVPEDHLPLSENHTPPPLALWTLTMVRTCFLPRSLDKHSFQDHHSTTYCLQHHHLCPPGMKLHIYCKTKTCMFLTFNPSATITPQVKHHLICLSVYTEWTLKKHLICQ